MDGGSRHCTGGSDQDHPPERKANSQNACLGRPYKRRPEKRSEAKGKEEKERYTHLNAEFQRIARRDKKAFLKQTMKRDRENNRMGKD